MLKFASFSNLLLLQKEWDQSSLGFACSSYSQSLPYSMPKYFVLANIWRVSYSPCFVDPEVMNQENLTNKTHQKHERIHLHAQDNGSVS